MEQRLLSLLQQQFGPRLLGVALFGSHARGQARWDSDVDLLLVVQELSGDRERDQWVHQLRQQVWEGEWNRAEFVLIDQRELENGLAWYHPLLLSIAEAYRILYDPEEVFARTMRRLQDLFQTKKVIKTGERAWYIPEWEVI